MQDPHPVPSRDYSPGRANFFARAEGRGFTVCVKKLDTGGYRGSGFLPGTPRRALSPAHARLAAATFARRIFAHTLQPTGARLSLLRPSRARSRQAGDL